MKMEIFITKKQKNSINNMSLKNEFTISKTKYKVICSYNEKIIIK